MTLDVAHLEQVIGVRGPVARVIVLRSQGSVPRGAGTSMLVWTDGFDGTIGGGALEWQALAAARAVLAGGAPRVLRIPLGPALGQCCGGAVTLAIERLTHAPDLPWTRRLEGDAPCPDLQGFAWADGWLREEAPAPRPVWIWGAGHVGAAIARILAPMPELAVTCIDDAAGRIPDLPSQVTTLVAARMPQAMAHAPRDAAHLILTYSHDIDLELCHAALDRGFGFCGLIGSQTKWARFRARLGALGHGSARIDRITCPIGDRALGKHPQAIAVGVAAGLLSTQLSKATTGDVTA